MLQSPQAKGDIDQKVIELAPKNCNWGEDISGHDLSNLKSNIALGGGR